MINLVFIDLRESGERGDKIVLNKPRQIGEAE